MILDRPNKSSIFSSEVSRISYRNYTVCLGRPCSTVLPQHRRNESDHIWRPIHSSLKRRKRMFMELFDWGLWEISITQCSSTSTTTSSSVRILVIFFSLLNSKVAHCPTIKNAGKGRPLCSRNFQNGKFRLDFVEI